MSYPSNLYLNNPGNLKNALALAKKLKLERFSQTMSAHAHEIMQWMGGARNLYYGGVAKSIRNNTRQIMSRCEAGYTEIIEATSKNEPGLYLNLDDKCFTVTWWASPGSWLLWE